jgi:hypothetical protein
MSVFSWNQAPQASIHPAPWNNQPSAPFAYPTVH